MIIALKRLLVAGLATGLFLSLASQAGDVAGSRDHPMVSRYAGSEIIAYEEQAFDEYDLIVDKITQYGGRGKNREATQPLEGKLTLISYKVAAQRTTLEVLRNYETAVKEGGFEILFACKNEDCGGRNFNHAVVPYTAYFGDAYSDQRYLAARLSRTEGDVYVAVYATRGTVDGGRTYNVYARVDVIELAPMEERMVTVDAKAMAEGIAAEGHMALYNIYFDTGKAELKPESQPSLAEIARLLQAQPELRLLVVGHTDNVGELDYNEDLSRRRAQAVVHALTMDHGIAQGRLVATGVGMYAPVATNRTEQGRSLNRRVELVER
jgi:outer membrane protein OmpA-like peptidoglycan-associated protein